PVRAMAVLALPPLIQRAVEYHLRQAGGYAMSDGWYYADAGKPVGPMTVDALADHLRTTPNSGDADIWHSTLRTWRAAKDVPQIFDKVLRPPPPPQRRSGSASVAGSRARSAWHLAAFFGTVAFVVLFGAFLTSVIYGNSPDGIAEIVGEFTGAAVVPSLAAWSMWRRSPYATGAV